MRYISVQIAVTGRTVEKKVELELCALVAVESTVALQRVRSKHGYLTHAVLWHS